MHLTHWVQSAIDILSSYSSKYAVHSFSMSVMESSLSHNISEAVDGVMMKRCLLQAARLGLCNFFLRGSDFLHVMKAAVSYLSDAFGLSLIGGDRNEFNHFVSAIDS